MNDKERIDYLEQQVAILTDMLAESDFRERLAEVEAWIKEWDDAAEEFGEVIMEGLEVTLVPDQELLDAVARDKSKDN